MTTTPASPPEPQPFPVPDYFTFEWPDPADAHKQFMQDRMHSPYPMTPMAYSWARVFATGFSAGAAVNSLPMGATVLRLNTYFYLGVNPIVPPEEMPAHEAKAQAALMQAAPRVLQRWRDEWLPELQKSWDDWNSVDLASLNDADLVERARKGIDLYRRAWTIHFEMLIPAMAGASLFEDAYGGLFPGRPMMEAYALTRGFSNMSVEAGRQLWLIARDAAANPELKQLIDATHADALWNALESTPAGRDLRGRLSRYLAVYGRRSDNVQEVATPSWLDDPAPALANLKAYVNDPVDPAEIVDRHAEERERRLADIRAALANHPEEVRGQFEGLLHVAQAFSQLQEDHNFWIDQRSAHEMRHLCLELGRRLAAKGSIAETNDIFMLDLDEALTALTSGLDEAQQLVRTRRQEMAAWAEKVPPPFVGMDYGPPPDNPVTRALSRFFGGPPRESEKANELLGNPGAPGKVTGIARIVMSIDEGHRLGQDEILVTPTTAPPWTPLFATAAAVVTEIGAQLSHCAVVAREYGIPAAVGVPGATALIRDGARVEVDGDAGVVRLLD
jgi:pyruvate,water dikinase